MSLKHRIAARVKGNPFLWRLFWHGATRWPILLPHERAYHGLKHFANPQGGLILDLGANNGISALGFAKILPNYRIFCVEAHPRHRASLELAKQKLGGRMDYMIIGASDAEGEIPFYTPVINGVVQHTLTGPKLEYVKTATERDYPSRRIEYKNDATKVIPLDRLGLSPDLIKIDIEDSEAGALRGLEETIARSRPVVLMEWTPGHSEEVEAFLVLHRYKFLAYDADTDSLSSFDAVKSSDSWRTPGYQVNVFCVPQEKSAGP